MPDFQHFQMVDRRIALVIRANPGHGKSSPIFAIQEGCADFND